MNGLATRNRMRQATSTPPAHDFGPAEGETTPGDIIVGFIGIVGSAALIVEAFYLIWRMYS